MRVPVEIQVWRLSVLFLAGAALDLLFQSYRAFRSVFRTGKIGRHLLDAVVALVTLAAIGAVVFLVNWGEVRLYVPVSLAGGFAATSFFAGDATYRASRYLFLGVRKSLRWMRRTVTGPLRAAVSRAVEWLSRTLSPPPDPS